MVKYPSKLKELTCVIFGHDLSVSGKTTCQTHKQVFNEFRECERCGVRLVGPDHCPECYIDFKNTLLGE